MRILYDSKDENFKRPFGCVKVEQDIEISIHIPETVETIKVKFVLTDDFGICDQFEMHKTNGYEMYEVFNCKFSLDKAGLYFYYFNIEAKNSTFKLFKQGYKDTNMEAGDLWQLTCVSQDYSTPEKFKGALMYQIFPDRFCKVGCLDISEKLTPFTVHENKSDVPAFLPDEHGEIQNNDFFGGNLKGIIEKLPYILKLGVKIIYLNPIFKAYSNHRYDTADYKKIDPMLGTYEDFVNLCKSAKSLGMSIVLDGVFSHTGINSVYFNDALKNPQSVYKDWYQFKNYPNEYECWWGIKTLPNVNELCPSYLEYIIDGKDSVVEYWLNAGADGFRLDVADELPDLFIKKLRKRVKEIKSDAIVIGEVWEDASNKSSYGERRKYFTDNELDSVMNYPFNNGILGFLKNDKNAYEFSNTVMTIAENYPKDALDCLMNSLSTHDTIRAITFLGNQPFDMKKVEKANSYLEGEQLNQAIVKLKQAAFLQYVLPGNPCIYYGDEVCLQGFEDPFNRRFFPWENINYDVLNYYISLGEIKNTYSQLKTGKVFCYAEDEDTIVVDRDDLRAVVNRKRNIDTEYTEVIFKTDGCVLIKKR